MEVGMMRFIEGSMVAEKGVEDEYGVAVSKASDCVRFEPKDGKVNQGGRTTGGVWSGMSS